MKRIIPVVPVGPTALLHELTIGFQPGKISPELPVICCRAFYSEAGILVSAIIS
nr:MAG TPA: hypothetical protein [Bacteriophage sp.]